MATHLAIFVTWGSARRVSWQWDRMVHRYRTNYPDRFDLEVASEGEPCAFALGKPSGSRSHCSLEYVEASPDPSHPLKGRVLAVVITALERYCVALGAPEMRIVQPFPALIPLYEGKYGFALAKDQGGHPYWRREVKP